ncbi:MULTISPECIES: hypothetical protein [unclassified Flavobacterium]|uniref:hypothetical protein n=1 Tax=unclassified Flavobacterium TaxID=196869 RepID=UPI0013EBE351|nr:MULTISPECIES: hypothetical protein [unclassified Flavobacterium]MCD0474466.1 hypothetical protein [Flavobacterium sp. EDS]
MLKSILKLKGAQVLTANEQKSINGGAKTCQAGESIVCCPNQNICVCAPPNTVCMEI